MSTVASTPPLPNTRGSHSATIASQNLLAIDKTAQSGSDYHRKFIGETILDNKPTNCFVLSLKNLPLFAHIGWRVGKGRESLQHRGVDLLLCLDQQDDGAAGIHARFNWVKGASGFFLIADNKSGKKVLMDGEIFGQDQRLIHRKNTIMIGECIFTLQYSIRDSVKEEQFQLDLRHLFRRCHGEQHPLILPTPGENDSRIGDWIFQQPLSSGGFGIVHMVINSHTGQPAAAKWILKCKRNGRNVDKEIIMARKISKFTHDRICSPQEIIHLDLRRSKSEIDRIQMYLDEKWTPTAENLTDEYIIISPLLNATFHSLYGSNVSAAGRETFFSQLLEAIAFLHDQGIWHRDVKPANILVRSYDPPDSMLTDFGCASDKAAIRFDGTGTPRYLAPEQQYGELHGKEVDYWSCGIIGLELVRGRVIESRIKPCDDGLLDLDDQDIAKLSSPDILSKCSQAMLQIEPHLRMTAVQGLKLFQPPRVQQQGPVKRRIDSSPLLNDESLATPALNK
ncbi:kinase-like domain-containing protein [Penicillium angulare]|uniref:kinase-like domain-containing protein n=1 Tax=Penicillium angulare TaxID=116970 RepID=UPI002540D0E1|nr:kinase-like domain-containing protein [Penicillium angulare]KAJ5291489.1 kinase-like domain-containing protein [Penicillium angulare]